MAYVGRNMWVELCNKTSLCALFGLLFVYFLTEFCEKLSDSLNHERRRCDKHREQDVCKILLFFIFFVIFRKESGLWRKVGTLNMKQWFVQTFPLSCQQAWIYTVNQVFTWCFSIVTNLLCLFILSPYESNILDLSFFISVVSMRVRTPSLPLISTKIWISLPVVT